MQEFMYKKPTSLNELVRALAEEGACALSGGTDLIPQLREGRKTARTVVDIKGIADTQELRFDPETGLLIGSSVPCMRICQDENVVRHYPGLLDAVSLIGATQIQGRASIGGNLCNASPAADSIPALIVHSAICNILGPHGRRQVAVDAFCIAPGKNMLLPGEVLLSLQIPTPRSHFGAAYRRFIPRNEMDMAVVGSAVSVELDDECKQIKTAQVALSAVAPTPLLIPTAGEFLSGQRLSGEQLADEAALRGLDERILSAVKPISDLRGTATQRRHLAQVLTHRGLTLAIQRAMQNRRGLAG